MEKVWKRAKEKDLDGIRRYLMKEREFNLFIIGDIENHGLHTDFLDVYLDQKDEKIYGVLLRYYNSYVFYTKDKDSDRQGVVDIASEHPGKFILSGKRDCLIPLLPLIKRDIKKKKALFFASLKEISKEIKVNTDVQVKLATLKEARELYDMLMDIEEFSEETRTSYDAFVNSMKSGASRRYIIIEDGKIVSTASTAAENSMSAMVVAVATKKGYRNKGYATSCMYQLSSDLLAEGKILCLFYDNPEAGKIYKRLGFKEMGIWQMIYID